MILRITPRALADAKRMKTWKLYVARADGRRFPVPLRAAESAALRQEDEDLFTRRLRPEPDRAARLLHSVTETRRPGSSSET